MCRARGSGVADSKCLLLLCCLLSSLNVEGPCGPSRGLFEFGQDKLLALEQEGLVLVGAEPRPWPGRQKMRVEYFFKARLLERLLDVSEVRLGARSLIVLFVSLPMSA